MDNDHRAGRLGSVGTCLMGADRPPSVASIRAERGIAAEIPSDLSPDSVQPTRPRRRAVLLALPAVLSLPLLPSPALTAGQSKAPPPLTAAQQRLIVDFLILAHQLLGAYVFQGQQGGGAADGAYRKSVQQQRQRSAQLLRRIKTELKRHFVPAELDALVLRWESVLSAVVTPPALDVARLMLPMAREVTAPLLAMLPAYDPRRGEPRARRQLALATLMHLGCCACWDQSLVDWPLLDDQRELLEGWLASRDGKSMAAISLQARWNLFFSALPMPGGSCMAHAADTLQSVGKELAQTL